MDAERQWLELMGHVMAAPLTVLPEEHIATAITVDVCKVQVMWPSVRASLGNEVTFD